MPLDALGIKVEKQNTLIQNLKQVKSFQNRKIVLVDTKGKELFVGKYKDIPKKYLHVKVKSVNNSISNPKVLAYVLLSDKPVEKPNIVKSDNDNDTLDTHMTPMYNRYKVLAKDIKKELVKANINLTYYKNAMIQLFFVYDDKYYVLGYIREYHTHYLYGKFNNKQVLLKAFSKIPTSKDIANVIHSDKLINTKPYWVGVGSRLRKDVDINKLTPIKKETYKGFDIYEVYEDGGNTRYNSFYVVKEGKPFNILTAQAIEKISNVKKFIREHEVS